MRYPAVIEGGGRDYGVLFPDLPGCMAMGSTLEGAISNAEEAMLEWMESMAERGLSIAPPSAFENIEVPPNCTLAVIAPATAAATSA